MLPQMDVMDCHGLAVPATVMQHVVQVESARNPFAIGVVGGRLVRQPTTLAEAVATARMLEQRRYNFSLGMAQVNRYNLKRYGLDTYERAFDACPNIQAGARILAECNVRAGGDWGKSFSCYYSGNFTTGFRHGYVQRVFASMQGERNGATPMAGDVAAIPLAPGSPKPSGESHVLATSDPALSLRERRVAAPARERFTPIPNPIVPIVADPEPAATGRLRAAPLAGDLSTDADEAFADAAFVF